MIPCRAYAALAIFANVLYAADTLTIEQALELTERNHPQLQAGIAFVDVARAGITTAKAHPNPEAGVIFGRQTARVSGNVTGSTGLYSFVQPLELGALRPTRLQVAQRGRESSEFALAEVRLDVFSGVRRAFHQVLRRKSEIDLAGDHLRRVEALRQRIRVLVDVGEVGRLELLRADAEAATARTLANSAQLELVNAMSQLQASVGFPLVPGTELERVIDPPLVLPPIDQLRPEAVERHPALALMRSEVRRADARVNYEMALRRPQPYVRGEIDYAPDTPTFRAGISIPVPFWNRREGPIAEAVANLRQVTALAQARELEILAALEGAYGRYQIAGQQVAAFETGVIREATEALDAAEVAYQLGERGVLEVLDAQRVLRGVRLDYLTAQYERQTALIDLDQLRAVELRRPIP